MKATTPMKATTLVLAAAAVALAAPVAQADDHGWEGKRRVSEQRPNDLFYNYYVGPQPSGAAAGMYVSPLPAPAHVGHTYTTYQPLMPHEMLYGHQRSYHTHHPGAGWTRTNVRYKATGSRLQALSFGLYDNTVGGWLQNGHFNTYQVKPWRLF